MADLPTNQEIREVIQSMKPGKAPGPDNIQAELIKYGDEQGQSDICYLITTAWASGSIPSDFKDANITKIYKKGEPMMCSNYRGMVWWWW